MFKIAGAIIGYFLTGRNFIGGVVGFLIGSLLDNFNVINAKKNGQKGNNIFDYYQQHASQSNQDFATMLMALSAAVMKADGKILKSELEFIKSFFVQQFGPQFSSTHLQTLKHFLDAKEIPLEQICRDIVFRTQAEVRIQLMHYLFGIAKSDGHVAEEEIQVLKRISVLLEIPARDFDSLKGMFYRNVNSDFEVLGITANATDEEIKRAYRAMAVKHHPDKVTHMGEEYQKGAKEKFQKIQEAYENIKKARGIA